MSRWLQLALHRIAPAWFLHPGPTHAELDEYAERWDDRLPGETNEQMRQRFGKHRV